MSTSVNVNGNSAGSVGGTVINSGGQTIIGNGNGNGNGAYAPISGSNTQLVGSNGLPIPHSLLNLQLATQTVIESVVFVIIKKDGTRLQLVEKSTISLREMIGICKFVSTASAHASSKNIQWSSLIKKLNIENHFDSVAPGQKYPSTDLVINLHDIV